MFSGIIDFFTGSDKSNKNIEEHLPIPQHNRPLSHTDCFTWLNKKVVILLKKFDKPQIGVVKYIGSDDKGTLCAGIEFEYDVGGMNGKVHGQKLFKTKPGHGLLIPVEFVRLLEDHENGRNIFPASAPPPQSRSNSSSPSTSTSASQNTSRNHTVPNLNGGTNGNIVSNIPLEDYTPVKLEQLKIGDNAVWLGGDNAQTGIVRWIGNAGKSVNIPIKVWMEMDDYMGFGHTELDVGTKFGCASGRGKLVPADQLILLENFIPPETTTASPQELPYSPPPVVEPIIRRPSLYPDVPNDIFATLDSHQQKNVEPIPSVPVPQTIASIMKNKQPAGSGDNDLIDFSDGQKCRNAEDLKITPEGNTITDLEFLRVMNEEPMDTDDGCTGDGLNSLTNTLETESSIAATDEFVFVASAPDLSFLDDSPTEVKPSIITPETIPQSNENEIDINGNLPETQANTNDSTVVRQNGFVIPETLLEKLIDDTEQDYLPPFTVPPIEIVEFFRAEQGLKGIQGKRNSCYIDVVLFSMFAFTDKFDDYFLVKNNKDPDSQLTKTAKKILVEQIVSPLRGSYYCPAKGVNQLRELMIPLFSDKLDGAFLDIEEFMLMFFKLFQLKEFIQYDNQVTEYLYQVNLGDHNLPPVITLKQCLDLSFKDYNNLKLASVPTPAFIVQIPRNHSGIIQSTTIVPNLTLDMESLLKASGDNAMETNSRRTIMNLCAVICINDFHFVTFVKCGRGTLSHWVLFDSNPSEEVPKVEIVTNMGECLESLEHQVLTNPVNVAESKHKLPPLVQRLLSDIYVCIYCPA